MRQRLDNWAGKTRFRMLTGGNQVFEHAFHATQIRDLGLDLRQAGICNVAN